MKFALLIVAFFFAVVAAVFFGEKLASIFYFGDVSPFLYKWQTLISGFLAVLGAYITIYKLTKNHKEALEAAEKLHNGIVSMKASSLRAYLPENLISLNEYCKACFEYIAENSEGSLPEYDKDNMNIIKDCIAHDTSNELRDLVNFFYVHNRDLEIYRNAPKDDRQSEERNERYINVLELNARVWNVCEYAIGEEDKIPMFSNNGKIMQSSLESLNGNRHQDPYEEVLALIKKVW